MRTRKKKNGDARLRNLSCLLIDTNEIGALSGAFDTERPLRLEIGCGKGDFVVGLSAREPDYNYLAVERISDVALIAVEKYAAARGLGRLGDHGEWITPDGAALKGEPFGIPPASRGNVRFLIAAAENVLPLLPPSSFDAVYTNFSDPWPKKGYAARRLTHPRYLTEYARILVPGGRLNLKTDNDGLFAYSLETLEELGWDVLFSTGDLHGGLVPAEIREANVETEYERKFTEQGVAINCLIASPPSETA